VQISITFCTVLNCCSITVLSLHTVLSDVSFGHIVTTFRTFFKLLWKCSTHYIAHSSLPSNIYF